MQEQLGVSFLPLSKRGFIILCPWGKGRQSIYTLLMKAMAVTSLERQILFPGPFHLETAK